MRIETHNQLGALHNIECTRLVIYDSNETPIAVAMQQTPSHIFIMHAGEEGFENALQAMGVKGTTIIDRIDKKQLPQPPGKLWKPGDMRPDA